MPWWALLLIELVKLIPHVFKAVKNDPNEDNKQSTKVVVSRIKEATVGEPLSIKRL